MFFLDNAYELISGEFIIREGAVTSGQPSEVELNKALICDSSGVFNFRVGRELSKDVADWFNSIIDTKKKTTFGHDAGELHFAYKGDLAFLFKEVKTGETVLFRFNGVVLAQGHSGSTNNWWLGGDTGYYLEQDKISLSTNITTKHDDFDNYSFICKRGNDKVDKIEIGNIYRTSWLSKLSDELSINQINIPGTHDSGTGAYEEALVEPWAKTQNFGIKEQLDSGIRYLDIRCRHINNAFAIHHGNIYLGINFTDVLDDCIQFLKENPHDCILMQVKEEYDPQGNTQSFYETFISYVNQTKEYWGTNSSNTLSDTIPLLKEIRGKIFLLRRFSDWDYNNTTLRYVDVYGWADNSKRFECHLFKNETIVVQDEYKNSSKDKIAVVNQLAVESNLKPDGKWFINYSSTTDGAITLPKLSSEVNKDVLSLAKAGLFFGTIVLNYPDDQEGLVDEIINYNNILTKN